MLKDFWMGTYSPIPPEAMPGLPVVDTAILFSDATSVPAPLSNATPPYCSLNC